MKKRLTLALAMLLCLCLLAACQTSEPEKFTVKTAGSTGAQTQQTTQTQPAAEEEDNYDPLAEEDDYSDDLDYWQGEIATPAVVTATPAPTVRSDYAGATPVPIDPIDLPTPTAAPPLPQFSYKTYDATKLGLSFDGPTGWLVDDTAADSYVIQNPKAGIYPATLTIHAEKVSSQYSENDLKTVVQNMLTAIGQSSELAEYSPSNTAGRSLLGATGVYANYTGVMNDGSQIAGRVHAACVEKVLYTVHITYPREYTEGYKEQVYDKLRDTIQITK